MTDKVCCNKAIKWLVNMPRDHRDAIIAFKKCECGKMWTLFHTANSTNIEIVEVSDKTLYDFSKRKKHIGYTVFVNDAYPYEDYIKTFKK